MREDSFVSGADDDINVDDINPTDSVIITWPIKKGTSVPEDEIIYEEVVDDVPTLLDEHGRPYTSFSATDRDGRMMIVECHTASDGSHYTIEHRVSADGVPHSIQYPGDWEGEAWKYDPRMVPEWKREQIGRDFLGLFMKFMQDLEKNPERMAEFEAGVEEDRKRKKKK